MNQFRFLIFPAALAIVFGIASLIPGHNTAQTKITELPAVESPVTTPVVEPPKVTTLIFGGDIMLARSVATSVTKNFGGDYSKLFEHLPEFKTADIAFANLEGPISAQGRNVGSKFSFRFDPKVVPALKDAGFDVFSTSNNHMGDWTKLAFDDTMRYLSEVEIGHAGAGLNKTAALTPYVIEKNGMRFGFVAYTDVGPNWLAATETSSGIAIADPKTLPAEIEQAKTWCDFLIVSFHWGDEYKAHNARQTLLARAAVDAGADMVIGHHPHVEQDTEWYNGKFIAYSLGNFIFDQYFSPETMQGLVIKATVDEAKTVEIEKYTLKLSPQYQPQKLTPKPEDIEPEISIPEESTTLQTGPTEETE
ncbi:MAG TPA: CapA family protein [Blastocatellia bacterium]|nr:CapA family protein [Blastocatellia bacterium]